MDERFKFEPDAEKAYKLYVDTVMPRCGSSLNRDDFGGPSSYGVNLRRKDADHNPTADWIDGTYGIHLGLHGDKWIVAVKSIGYKLLGLVAFDSLSELKQLWELD